MQTTTPPFTEEQVKKAVWEGGIPIVFTLHQNDLTTFEPPLPFYISLINYYILITETFILREMELEEGIHWSKEKEKKDREER